MEIADRLRRVVCDELGGMVDLKESTTAELRRQVAAAFATD
ncbi:hypothetical protein [Mesorhizobium sp. WSM3626]|nr:hypothetical protein [Mesorhizobium sp. WSM3626]